MSEPGEGSVEFGASESEMPILCARCGVRRGTIHWVGEGGVMAMTHGGGAMWCARCVAEASLAYARKQAERIPELEATVRRIDDEEGAG